MPWDAASRSATMRSGTPWHTTGRSVDDEDAGTLSCPIGYRFG